MNAAYSDTAFMKKTTIVCSCGRSTYEMKAALPRLDVWCMFAVNHFTFVPTFVLHKNHRCFVYKTIKCWKLYPFAHINISTFTFEEINNCIRWFHLSQYHSTAYIPFVLIYEHIVHQTNTLDTSVLIILDIELYIHRVERKQYTLLWHRTQTEQIGGFYKS